jgi:hypothetical protein
MLLTLFATTTAFAMPREPKDPPLKKIIKKIKLVIQSLEGGYISPPRP